MADESTTLQIILDLKDELTGDLKKVVAGVDGLENKLKDTEKASESMGKTFKNVLAGIGVGFLAKQFFDVGKSIVDVTGNFEQFNVSFRTMLGSSTKAKELLNDIKNFAASTPFELPEVVEGSKRLLAYNVAAKDIIPTFTTLGNIAAGVGTEKLPQLITAFGQVSAKGRLMGQELLQFTEAGVNLGGELSKQFGVSREALEKMISAGKVGFADVEKALKNMGSGTGQFAGLMEAQSKTIQGMWSNTKDNLTQTFLAIGNAAMPQMREIVTTMMDGLGKIKSWVESNQEVLAGTFKRMFESLVKVGEVLIEVGRFLYEYLITPIAEAQKYNVVRWLEGIGAAFVALNVIMSANPFSLVVIGIAALISSITYLYKNWETVVSFFQYTIDNIKGWVLTLNESFYKLGRDIGTIFKDAGQVILYAMSGNFSKVKESAEKLQNDLKGLSFNISGSTTMKSTTTTTSSTSGPSEDPNKALEEQLSKAAEMRAAANARSLEMQAAHEEEMKAARTQSTIDRMIAIEAEDNEEILKLQNKLMMLKGLRGNDKFDQIQLEKDITTTQKLEKEKRDMEDSKRLRKQLDELMKLREKDNVDKVAIDAEIENMRTRIQIAGENQRAIFEKKYMEESIESQKKKAMLENQVAARSYGDLLRSIGDFVEMAGEKYKGALIALKIIRTAEAIINTYAAATSALASSPYPYNLIAMASVIASGLVQVAKINSVQFAKGTSDVPGIGFSDTVQATLMPGEMVVPKGFADSIRAGELTLGGPGQASNQGSIVINNNFDGANFYGTMTLEDVKRIFEMAGDAIRAGLMSALPARA